MKTTTRKIISMCLFFIFPAILPAQEFMQLTDSIPAFKPKKARKEYVINYASLGTVKVSGKYPVKCPFPGGHAVNDSVDHTGLTLFGFFSMHTARANSFLVSGKVDCGDPARDWKIALFCEGVMEKTRRLVDNEDGSVSMETDKNITLYWYKDAIGAIIENGDTIGRFYISMKPFENEYLQQFAEEMYTYDELPVKDPYNNLWYQDYLTTTASTKAYGIYGNFRDKEFAVITKGIYSKSYIFIDLELSCVFQPDIDLQPMLNKEDRVMPYFLFNSSSPESLIQDAFRLGILSRYLTEQFYYKHERLMTL